MTIHRRMELIANVSMVVVSAAILYVLVTNSTAKTPTAKVIQPREMVELPGVEWRASRRTLVLFLQEGCGSCEDSVPFHKSIIAEARSQKAQTIAVLPKRSPDGVRYAEDLGFAASQIFEADPRSLGVHRVPSIVIVGPSGHVQRVWVGRLTQKQEDEVLRTIRNSSL